MATEKAVVQKETNLPAHIQQGSERGSEDVGTDDLIIPRLELAQALSPAQKKKDDNYIKGCEEGMLYNNVTRDLYGEGVVVCPVVFKKEYLLWRDRKDDIGGFHGAYPDLATAEAAKSELERPENVEAIETHQHFCLLVKNSGGTEEIVISMARSKMKISRGWNSLVRINQNDRFSRVYKLSTFTDSNSSGDEFMNFKVTNVSGSSGFASPEVYKQAEALYDSIRSGTVTVDRTVEEPAAEEKGEY